ncbi:mechanosensitive ion channel family protein [Winogradskyella tangerina]|uniref:mechanosensitive ion channel family protein n=1 Tax=Winogradskyella tangerina TaxID=2023240 RepID=UPI000DBE6C9F|nr:mechanosensitive ion channel domain-containing protein [Winogradskyella tangerina]
MNQGLRQVEEQITESSTWEKISGFLDKHVDFGEKISISILDFIIVITAIVITTIILKIVFRIITRNLPEGDKGKFNVIYGYFRWLVYIVIFLITLHSVGVNVTAVFAASAALLIGVGLALQTLFQDIISGVFILIDQTVHVGDIIELDGKIGRVEEIKLRTTRAVTIDNKVLVIPNHLYLTNSLYNWTQNGTLTRESVSVGVAYGSDVQLVKKLLLQAASTHPDVIDIPEPKVLFTDFGDSSLNFKLIFTLNDSFMAAFPKSDIRFEIDKLFREHNVTIPFPQRDVHIIEKK